MKGLESAADEFFRAEEKSGKDSKMKKIFSRKKQSVESRVEQQFRQANARSLDDVKDLVQGMAQDWKEKHGKARLLLLGAPTLSDLMAVVPKENMYVGILCGGLSMVVQASVNHSEIADNLSRATAHICERAAVCAGLVDVIKKSSMQKDLAEVYKQLFSFLLEAGRWFNKSGFSRFFDSFNTAVKEKHDAAVAILNEHIDLIAQKGFVEGLLRTEDVRQTADIIEWKLDLFVIPRLESIEDNLGALAEEVRKQPQLMQDQFMAAGNSMLNLLMQQVDTSLQDIVSQKLLAFENSRLQLAVNASIGTVQELPSVANKSREQAERDCKVLHSLLCGTDGVNEAQESGQLLADINVIGRLAVWIQESTRTSCKLWIDFPYEFQQDCPAKATALGMISITARSKAPFISYVCRKPRYNEIPETQEPERAGVCSAVYSLLLQLFKFRPQPDEFYTTQEELSEIIGPTYSFTAALQLLKSLLQNTPTLRYCIIHGLNDLETGDGLNDCKAVVEVLFSHARRAKHPFSILFTTAGQSRALYALMDRNDRASSDASTTAVAKRGLDLNMVQM
ncbi:hypothetical protein K491DRAFT_679769 [Lophiostoma macrostomum CBS 122681]|uniref:DUF7708 domain-containing protein n=1 Tax=Lophiostoma macrostomum CBS 122681 TaxID=1314788 RepID=A0A6A6T6W2_9PLEO|nr:hypothetical protein K491DRAFT_679769 [Lophiostoma macrostomum CBS 122681]